MRPAASARGGGGGGSPDVGQLLVDPLLFQLAGSGVSQVGNKLHQPPHVRIAVAGAAEKAGGGGRHGVVRLLSGPLFVHWEPTTDRIPSASGSHDWGGVGREDSGLAGGFRRGWSEGKTCGMGWGWRSESARRKRLSWWSRSLVQHGPPISRVSIGRGRDSDRVVERESTSWIVGQGNRGRTRQRSICRSPVGHCRRARPRHGATVERGSQPVSGGLVRGGLCPEVALLRQGIHSKYSVVYLFPRSTTT